MKRASVIFLVVFLVGVLCIQWTLAQDAGTVPTATVTQNPLNFRDKPSKSGQVIQKLNFGTSYSALTQTQSGYWYQLDVNGVKGWVCAKFVDLNVSASQLPIDSTAKDEDCKGTSLNTPVSTPESVAATRYTYRIQYGEGFDSNCAVINADTGEVLFVTYSEYSSGNDVKKCGFNADHTMFAAAYHYSPNYTWVGVWSVDGTFLWSKTKDGFWYTVSWAFDQ